MGEHWRKVWEIAQVLVGNTLLLCLWILLLTLVQTLLVAVSGKPEGPVVWDFLEIKKIVEAGELIGLIGLIVISILDIIKLVRR